jgi:hypothetical protein
MTTIGWPLREVEIPDEFQFDLPVLEPVEEPATLPVEEPATLPVEEPALV